MNTLAIQDIPIPASPIYSFILYALRQKEFYAGLHFSLTPMVDRYVSVSLSVSMLGNHVRSDVVAEARLTRPRSA
jgi:hypothetical protein